MKIYRVQSRRDGQESDGFTWFLSKREATKLHKSNQLEIDGEAQGDEVEEFDVSMNKHDIISFLNSYCAYADNG
jgi:hypothetical protein